MPQPATGARARDALTWFLIVVGSFVGLGALAFAAFASAPPIQVLISSSTVAGLADKERAVQESSIRTYVPEDGRDVRILWRPSTNEFAGAWHGKFDPTWYAECPVLPSPELPDFAARIVHVGDAPFDAYECSDVVVTRIGDTTYAWTR
jgi:hypothetical protein